MSANPAVSPPSPPDTCVFRVVRKRGLFGRRTWTLRFERGNGIIRAESELEFASSDALCAWIKSMLHEG